MYLQLLQRALVVTRHPHSHSSAVTFYMQFFYATTCQKAFIHTLTISWRFSFHSMTFYPSIHVHGGGGGGGGLEVNQYIECL